MTLFDRFGNQLEGRGRMILYALGGIVLIGLLTLAYIKWSNRKTDEARRALGRAITIATTPVASGSPDPASVADPTAPKFSSESERAQRSVEEFQKVVAKYGEPYHSEARYLAATNLLVVDRNKGIAELVELSKSNNLEVAALAKFALAQAHEVDGKYDEAAQLYRELAGSGSQVVTSETANLRLALVYAKQGKKKEASDLLFSIVESSRKAKGSDQMPLPPSAAAGEAAEELQKLDPERYAQLPESPALG